MGQVRRFHSRLNGVRRFRPVQNAVHRFDTCRIDVRRFDLCQNDVRRLDFFRNGIRRFQPCHGARLSFDVLQMSAKSVSTANSGTSSVDIATLLGKNMM